MKNQIQNAGEVKNSSRSSTLAHETRSKNIEINSFLGGWIKEGSNNLVAVVITNTAWIAKFADATYNSGTYTYDGDEVQCEITNKGHGTANVGETGNAKIDGEIMMVYNFSDSWMNGTYSKVFN